MLEELKSPSEYMVLNMNLSKAKVTETAVNIIMCLENQLIENVKEYVY